MSPNAQTGLPASSPATMRVLDLFAGAGGAALGLHDAGFEHVACVERDASAAATLRAAGFPAVEADVRDLDYKALAGTIDVLWASPPCQAWSSANQHEGPKGEDDIARNGWPWTLRIVRIVRPRWAIFENVKNARGYVERAVLPELRTLYDYASLWVLNAADHGAPQSRTRIFVIAVRAPSSLRRASRAAPCAMPSLSRGIGLRPA